MIKISTVFVLLVLLTVIVESKSIVKSENTSGLKSITHLITFKDPTYNQPSTKFIGGETIYIKFTSISDGNLTRNVVLMDDKKNEIQKLDISKIDKQQLHYISQFTAPQASGQYYLSIVMKSEGNSFSFQQNIEIIGDKAETKDYKHIVDNQAEIEKESVLLRLIDKLKIIFQKIKFGIIKKA